MFVMALCTSNERKASLKLLFYLHLLNSPGCIELLILCLNPAGKLDNVPCLAISILRRAMASTGHVESLKSQI